MKTLLFRNFTRATSLVILVLVFCLIFAGCTTPTEPPEDDGNEGVHEHSFTETVTVPTTFHDKGEKKLACECGYTEITAITPGTELVRDYENYAKQITDCEEVSSLFGEFAEQQAIQAKKLLEILRDYEKNR